MNENLNEFPWATAIVVSLVVIAALVGGAVVVWGDNGALSFEDYLNDLAKFAAAVGLLGIGRGIRAHAKLAHTRRG